MFNVVFSATRVDPGIRDPALTEIGRAQAAAAAEALRGEDIRRVIASPYRRAIETAEIVARTLSVPLAVDALVRERCKFACDIGTPRAGLAALWRELAFDHLDEMWWSESEEPLSSLESRCRAFALAMAGAPDWPHVAVITHRGFIRALTGQTLNNGERIRFDPTAARL